MRQALLAHRDGARVVSAAQASTTMNGISELAMTTLVAHGLPLRQARLMVLTVERFTMGHVLEEQSAITDPPDGFDLAAYTRQFPTLIVGITDYFQPGRTVDDLFRDCLHLILDPPATPQ